MEHDRKVVWKSEVWLQVKINYLVIKVLLLIDEGLEEPVDIDSRGKEVFAVSWQSDDREV